MYILPINGYNNTNPAFSSKLEPTNTLRDAFDHAKKTGDVKFLHAIKNILNDGKNDTIRIDSYRNPHYTDEYLKTLLYVNDSEIDALLNADEFCPKEYVGTGNRILDSIKLIVRNFSGKKQVRTELDDIYKKYKLGEGDTRHLSDNGPEFF